jgi:hypothetical protein
MSAANIILSSKLHKRNNEDATHNEKWESPVLERLFNEGSVSVSTGRTTALQHFKATNFISSLSLAL